jgi:tRNA nucleotidyltransferase (CCA-adding enzyme)
MKPNTAASMKSQRKVTNKMFDQAVDPEALVCIALADDRGRIQQIPEPDPEEFLMQRLQVFREIMDRPYVMGRDLIEAGLKPGAEFTELLKFAHKLRLAGVNRDSALKQTLAQARKLKGE